jgi:tripeptidyl-peptidase-1
LLKHSVNSEIYSSDPKSSRYGNHYTLNEVTDLFAPSTTTVEVVKSWIVDSGIREERISQSSNKAWLQFDASIEEMEQLLQTKYYYYEHVSGGPKHIGCEHYKVPAALSDHIDYVTPGAKPVATRAVGDITQRDLASLRSRGQVGKPIPPNVLARVKEDASMYCQSGSCVRVISFADSGLHQMRLTTSRLLSLRLVSELYTTLQLAHFQIQQTH